ncbi:MAG: CoA transferase [Chloroflexi bacterium]|nr:CoA transferase [Chloroflexota bacterium]
MGGPLEGIRVLEFTQIIAGPFCGVALADFGADVVKVEPIDGGPSRRRRSALPGENKTFHALNRGKRSIAIDLKHPDAERLMAQLVPTFDVVVSNMGYGAAERLGIDYDSLRRYREDLIWAENTGFGGHGRNASRAGSDIVAQAYSGLMAAEVKCDELGGPELVQCTGIVDYPAGVVLAMGVCAALVHRERTGEGQLVRSSLLSTGMMMMGREIARSPIFDAVTRDPMMERITAVRERGGDYCEVVNERGGVYDLLGPQLRLYYGGYAVRDGAIIIGALSDRNRQQIRDLLGIDDDPTEDLEFDVLDPANRPAIDRTHRKIAEALRTRTADEWIAEFDRLGVPASKVNLPEELADDPGVQEAGIMLEVEHELAGREQFVGSLVEMSGSPTGSPKPSPLLGRHTREVLGEAGLSAEEIEALHSDGAVATP